MEVGEGGEGSLPSESGGHRFQELMLKGGRKERPGKAADDDVGAVDAAFAEQARQPARASMEQALALAEPDRLIFPFAMTGAWQLLKALRGTSHTALVADILGAVHDGAPAKAEHPPGLKLSPSELRVLRYLPTNLTRLEIASELPVSLHTINTHIRRIYAKLGATDRSSAVQRGRDLRLLSPTQSHRQGAHG
ncbi:response regulator transcription factor [Nonomuraea sp. NEAU-A123]|uniref:response regulator transcription factor n=1 Tax=Nonomuraea sp. NEAU-A123 TaxID=2839649 RepID=UPI001BE454FA|nr:LuxR C-terminal-related transcriptional regulator [Nonomuraea sp. NEAU-A123]MBT2225812.1 hypothetical protein [Nonomuraea sp. NEAU-A123]